MNDTPLSDAALSNLNLTFRDEDTARELRQLAQRSVAAIVSKSAAKAASMRVADAKRSEIIERINAPLTRLIQADPEASKALAELKNLPVLDDAEEDFVIPDQSSSLTSAMLTLPEKFSERDVFTRPPYNFNWSWHDPNGGAPFRSQFGPPNSGQVFLDGRCGDYPSATGSSVFAHAGFGLFLRTDRPRTAGGGGQIEQLTHSFDLAASGLNSYSLAEGGVEWTALENGRVIASGGRKLWRIRISSGESRSGNGSDYGFCIPTLNFQMNPGRDYTFNIGIWINATKGGFAPVGNLGGKAQQNAQVYWMGVN